MGRSVDGYIRQLSRKWCQGIADIAAEHARQMARGWQKDGSVDDGFVAIFVVFSFVDELKEQLAVCNVSFQL